MCRYLREEGKALVTQATDEQSQQTNAVTYIQVTSEIQAYSVLSLRKYLEYRYLCNGTKVQIIPLYSILCLSSET
jgi:hypothetical protein